MICVIVLCVWGSKHIFNLKMKLVLLKLVMILFYLKIMNIHCGDSRKGVLRGRESSMKCTSGQHKNFKTFVLRMEGFI